MCLASGLCNVGRSPSERKRSNGGGAVHLSVCAKASQNRKRTAPVDHARQRSVSNCDFCVVRFPPRPYSESFACSPAPTLETSSVGDEPYSSFCVLSRVDPHDHVHGEFVLDVSSHVGERGEGEGVGEEGGELIAS